MKSRGPRPILRRNPEGGNGGKGSNRFRYAAFRIAAKPVALRGFVRVSRSFKEFPLRGLHTWQHHSAQRENHASILGAADRPAGIGELINSLLRAGYSMKQIRAMYPGLFTTSPQPGS
jgi:hypothetical protein